MGGVILSINKYLKAAGEPNLTLIVPHLRTVINLLDEYTVSQVSYSSPHLLQNMPQQMADALLGAWNSIIYGSVYPFLKFARQLSCVNRLADSCNTPTCTLQNMFPPHDLKELNYKTHGISVIRCHNNDTL